MKRLSTILCALALLFGVVGEVNAEKKNLEFETADYCAASWNAATNTFTWGSGGWNSAWTFMTAKDLNGDLSSWETLHFKATNFTNSAESKLTVVFKKNDGSNPPSGPTKEFEVSPDGNGDITIDLTSVSWGDCDIKNIQDVTIYGGARTDDTSDASVVVTDAYIERADDTSAPGKLIKEVDFSTVATYDYWHANFVENNFTVSVKDDALQYENENAGDNWRKQFEAANGINLKKGANYVVRFNIKGSVAGKLSCILGDWSNTRYSDVNFTTTENKVDITLKDMPAKISNGSAHLLIQAGSYVGTIYIYKVQIFELESVDTYGDAIATKDYTSAGDQSINWKTDAAPAPIYSEENGMALTAESAAANFWDYQYNIAGANTENGKDYIIHLNVKGTEAKGINWSFGNYPNTVSGSFNVSTDWQTIELLCAGVPYTGYSDLAIQTGDYVATLYIKDVAFYPAAEGRLVEVGEAGFTTFGANKALKMRGVTAYAAKYKSGYVVLTPVSEIPANTGVIIEADEGTYKVPVIESASAIDNDLLVSDGTITGNGTSIYALAKKNDVVGFYKVANGVTILAGKAYMVISAGAREFIGFGEDATGVETVKQEAKADNQYFNLSGQRVAQPTKGLYIVNGKKVIIK